ncbi:MAG: DUF3800 domain-containing protein [Streptococcaceae bacterium]|jgi:hypothetical protein|nr:DUF3800 domain-containing protein [Streptococcaceae bacterium]MCH4177266.1 DUF3800 domain-containing protein [Streptococcaceae bacterium]
MEEINIYIDDSGQLHTNYYSDYFIYGGYWCLAEDSQKISKTYSIQMSKIYHTKKEIKSSNMKHKYKRKVLRKLVSECQDCFNPIFIASKVSEISIDFDNKQAVQLHKNYILRRLVEDTIKQIKKQNFSDISKINVFIDNQNQTKIVNRDSFPVYLNNYFKNNYLRNFTTTNVPFETKYLDSSKHKAIQIADLLANCKFNRYENNSEDLQVILDNLSDIVCRKHPIYFTHSY